LERYWRAKLNGGEKRGSPGICSDKGGSPGICSEKGALPTFAQKRGALPAFALETEGNLRVFQ